MSFQEKIDLLTSVIQDLHEVRQRDTGLTEEQIDSKINSCIDSLKHILMEEMGLHFMTDEF